MWDSIPSHIREILMNLNMLLKLGNLICAHAGFAKFIHKKKYIYVYKNTYMSRKIRISSCLTLYIYFSLFSYLLESMKFI